MNDNTPQSGDYTSLSYLEYHSDPMDPFYTHPLLGLISRMRLKNILKKISGLKGKTILDAGCEAGHLSIKLAEAGLNITPFDLCKDAIHDFKKKLKTRNNEKINDPMVADILHMPFKAETIDAIVCSEVIQFLESPRVFLGEFSRTLKKEGVLILSFGNHKNRKLFFPILHYLGFNTDAIDKTFPYQHSLEDFLSENGDTFTVEEIDYLPTRLITLNTIVVLRKK